jgi:hypothetical protein
MDLLKSSASWQDSRQPFAALLTEKSCRHVEANGCFLQVRSPFGPSDLVRGTSVRSRRASAASTSHGSRALHENYSNQRSGEARSAQPS